MPKAQFQHNLVLTEELEEAWRRKQEADPHIRFNPFVRKLIEEALCATAAPTSTTPSGT